MSSSKPVCPGVEVRPPTGYPPTVSAFESRDLGRRPYHCYENADA